MIVDNQTCSNANNCSSQFPYEWPWLLKIAKYDYNYTIFIGNVVVFVINFLILLTRVSLNKYRHLRFLINANPSSYSLIVIIVMIIQSEVFFLYIKPNRDLCTVINLIRSVGPVSLFMYIYI